MVVPVDQLVIGSGNFEKLHIQFKQQKREANRKAKQNASTPKAEFVQFSCLPECPHMFCYGSDFRKHLVRYHKLAYTEMLR